MHTVTAKRVLAAHNDAPVTLRYLDGDNGEALATFPSLATALQALSYDRLIRNVLDVTIQAADGPRSLASCDIDLLMDALRARRSVDAPNREDFSDLMRLADQVATLARKLGPARPLAVRIDKLGRT